MCLCELLLCVCVSLFMCVGYLLDWLLVGWCVALCVYVFVRVGGVVYLCCCSVACMIV